MESTNTSTADASPYADQFATAAAWLRAADAVLVVAGAGASVKEGEAVYVNRDDFAKFYPWAQLGGRKTAYECMGLHEDPDVPWSAKWAFWAQHMHHQRWGFEPAAGYASLLSILRERDYFVLSSNVDGCFERVGFAPERIYTPQGDWSRYQCLAACRPDAVWDARPVLDRLLPLINTTTGRVPDDAVPLCEFCGGHTFGNVRGGDWFLHSPHQEASRRFVAWCERQLSKRPPRLVVLEIGAGFNTPVVTRFPAESIAGEAARQSGSAQTVSFVRINPTVADAVINASVIDDARALSLPIGWHALLSIESHFRSTVEPSAQQLRAAATQQREFREAQANVARRPSGERFDWRRLMAQLARQ